MQKIKGRLNNDRRSPPKLLVFAGALILTIFIVVPEPANAEIEGWTSKKTRNVGQLVERYLATPDQTGSPKPTALSVAIGVNGALLFKKDYRSLRYRGQAAREGDTRYRIGSIAKQMTAAAVMKAIEEGARIANSGARLTISTPISSVIEGVAHWDDSNGEPITIKRLLTMTSQLPNFTQNPPPGFDPVSTINSKDLLRALKSLKPKKDWPGAFGYNNTSYFLLAEVLERIVGPNATRPEGYQQRLMMLFHAAKMKKTDFVRGDQSGRDVATPVFRRRPAFGKPSWLKGAGDLISTAEDLHRWNTALMSGRLINMDTLKLMHKGLAHASPEIWYGIGCYIETKRGRVFVSHPGYVPGFTSLNMIVKAPKQSKWASISVLMNADEAFFIQKVADDLAHIALSN